MKYVTYLDEERCTCSQWCSNSNTNDLAWNWGDICGPRKDNSEQRRAGVTCLLPSLLKWCPLYRQHLRGQRHPLCVLENKVKEDDLPWLGLWVNTRFNWEKHHFEQPGGDACRDETWSGSEIGSQFFSIHHLMSQWQPLKNRKRETQRGREKKYSLCWGLQ